MQTQQMRWKKRGATIALCLYNFCTEYGSYRTAFSDVTLR